VGAVVPFRALHPGSQKLHSLGQGQRLARIDRVSAGQKAPYVLQPPIPLPEDVAQETPGCGTVQVLGDTLDGEILLVLAEEGESDFTQTSDRVVENGPLAGVQAKPERQGQPLRLLRLPALGVLGVEHSLVGSVLVHEHDILSGAQDEISGLELAQVGQIGADLCGGGLRLALRLGGGLGRRISGTRLLRISGTFSLKVIPRTFTLDPLTFFPAFMSCLTVCSATHLPIWSLILLPAVITSG